MLEVEGVGCLRLKEKARGARRWFAPELETAIVRPRGSLDCVSKCLSRSLHAIMADNETTEAENVVEPAAFVYGWSRQLPTCKEDIDHCRWQRVLPPGQIMRLRLGGGVLFMNLDGIMGSYHRFSKVDVGLAGYQAFLPSAVNTQCLIVSEPANMCMKVLTMEVISVEGKKKKVVELRNYAGEVFLELPWRPTDSTRSFLEGILMQLEPERCLRVIVGATPIHECHWKESIKKTYNALFLVKMDLQKDDDSDAAALDPESPDTSEQVPSPSPKKAPKTKAAVAVSSKGLRKKPAAAVKKPGKK